MKFVVTAPAALSFSGALFLIVFSAGIKTGTEVNNTITASADSSGVVLVKNPNRPTLGVVHDNRTEKYVNIVAKPQITVKDGVATITCATTDAMVYYTTNGATPALVEENEYTKPFKISKGQTIKAMAKKYGVDNSSMVIYPAGVK